MHKKLLLLGALLALPVFTYAEAQGALSDSAGRIPVVAEISVVVRGTTDPDGVYVNGTTDLRHNMDVEAESKRVIGEGEAARRVETTVEMEASLWRTDGSAHRVEWEISLTSMSYEVGYFRNLDKSEFVSSESTVTLQPGETKTILAGNCRKAESVEERCTFEIKIALKPLNQN